MNKKILAALGLGAFALAVGMNLKHAADNYGVLYSNLAVQVVAQDNSSGGDGSGGGSDTGGDSNGGGSSNEGGESTGEGTDDGGVKRGYCYITPMDSDCQWDLKERCHRDTDEETIYPCPTTTSMMCYSESSKDSCIKE
jgi:hypothetical protein